MGREIKQEDLYLITKHLVRYAPAKPSIAIPRLLNIEVIRNTYTKSTLYQVFNGVKNILKTGRRHRHVSLAMFDIIMNNFYKGSTDASPEPAETVEEKPVKEEPVKIKPEEIVSQLKLTLQTIEENSIKEIINIDVQIAELNEKKKEINAVRDMIISDIKQNISHWTNEMYKEKWLKYN